MNFGILTLGAGSRIGSTNTAPTNFNGGTPTAAGLLSWASSVPATYLGGLGYTATGSLAVSVGGTAVRYAGGIPIAADGRVVAEAADAASFGAGGIPLTASGKLALAAATVLGAFSNGFSEGFS